MFPETQRVYVKMISASVFKLEDNFRGYAEVCFGCSFMKSSHKYRACHHTPKDLCSCKYYKPRPFIIGPCTSSMGYPVKDIKFELSKMKGKL